MGFVWSKQYARSDVDMKNNYHLFTETEWNSLFSGPETAVVAGGDTEGNNGGRGATKDTAFPRSLSVSRVKSESESNPSPSQMCES
jgi:5-methylcytosine-specific restriction endonuclease McrBC GTP-binding regulatory subunit McrB